MNRDRYFCLRANVSLAIDNCTHGLSYIYLCSLDTPCLEEIEKLLGRAKNALGDAHQFLVENKERMVENA